MRGTPEYNTWVHMVQRCHNPNNKDYEHYGGRGIKVCDMWRSSFEAFFMTVGKRPGDDYTIERIDTNDDYRPGNVKWATRQEQVLNQRSNINLTIDGETKAVSQWARDPRCPVSQFTIYKRVQRGWSDERAVLTPSKKRHGKCNTRTYQIWSGMKKRCDNPKHNCYSLYGGRGITYDPAWSDFVVFLRDMGEAPDDHSLDRIDNDGNYTKSNCRWSTNQEQARNRSSNVRLTIHGETKTCAEWSKVSGISRSTISRRLKRGWDAEEAVFTPSKANKATRRQSSTAGDV